MVEDMGRFSWFMTLTVAALDAAVEIRSLNTVVRDFIIESLTIEFLTAPMNHSFGVCQSTLKGSDQQLAYDEPHWRHAKSRMFKVIKVHTWLALFLKLSKLSS